MKTHQSHLQEDQKGVENAPIHMDTIFCHKLFKVLNSDTFNIFEFVLLKKGSDIVISNINTLCKLVYLAT